MPRSADFFYNKCTTKESYVTELLPERALRVSLFECAFDDNPVGP
jgi:hypothetical protein